jgi:hypothetical protein
MVKAYNPKIATRLMQLMKKHNAHWVSTRQTLKFEAFATFHMCKSVNNPLTVNSAKSNIYSVLRLLKTTTPFNLAIVFL